MRTRPIFIALIALITLFTGTAFAADEASANTPATARPLIEPVEIGEPITVDEGDVAMFGYDLSAVVAMDVVTQWFDRGILQENQGFIGQPSVTLNLGLGETVDFFFGTWNSIHSEETAATDSPDAWFESDFFAGTTITFDKISGTAKYTVLTSPSDALSTSQELTFTVGFDDSDITGDLLPLPGFKGFQPYVTLTFELDGSIDGMDEGAYLELGIAPSAQVVEVARRPVTLTVPVALGISVDDYYETPGATDTNGVGFVETGLIFSAPLAKSVTLSAGPSFIWLGDDAEKFNGGDDFEVVGKLGVSVSF